MNVEKVRKKGDSINGRKSVSSFHAFIVKRNRAECECIIFRCEISKQSAVAFFLLEFTIRVLRYRACL